MRCYRDSLLLSAIVILLGSCATNTVDIAGFPTFGRIQDISEADIRAAVSAYARINPKGPAHVGDIEVISRDEIRIYVDRAPSDYISMVRIRGRWQEGSVVLVHPAY